MNNIERQTSYAAGEDTIAAIATGRAAGGIAIIRISGDRALSIVDEIFRGPDAPLSKVPANTIHYGHILDIDEVLVSVFRAPHSYTTEDTVEINCHGGLYAADRVLSACIEAGARPAEPGEFTKRAYLSGRIDLSEAEAVADIISSDNEFSLKNSEKTLSGRLSREIDEYRQRIIYECGFIESALDDPEHFSLEGFGNRLLSECKEWIGGLSKLSASFQDGKILKDGIDTVIVGKPNVGKSSILNLLSNSDRAIVTDVPGTTRDLIEERVRVGELTLNLIDSAGIRSTDDVVEAIGVEKSLEKMKDADLVLFVCDRSRPLDENDKKIAASLSGKKFLVLLNKSDAEAVISVEDVQALFQKNEGQLPVSSSALSENAAESDFAAKSLKDSMKIIDFSARSADGMQELQEALKALFLSNGGQKRSDGEVLLTNARHKYEIDSAVRSLTLVMKSIESGLPEDFYTVDLMDAYSALGRILGKEVGDDLVEEIFSKFCIGK